MAANSVDLDTETKLTHSFSVQADIETAWNVGLIVGASGSGKTTLAKEIFGEDCFSIEIDFNLPVIEQFPREWTYEQCQKALIGIGLTSVPCWIRPMRTLSNGQQHRAIAALSMAQDRDFVTDEWTSVVDRTVAKAMSVCLGKYARRTNRKVVAVSCHYDILEWLDPDWMIDCNKAEYIDRRLLRRGERTEKLEFEIRSLPDGKSWRYFSQYHYLSSKLTRGLVRYFGLFHEGEQIGFQAFANYTPQRKNRKTLMHFNRTVIHPDYVGLGLGSKMIELTAWIMQMAGFEVWGKFSSAPVANALSKSSNWKLRSVTRFTAAPKIGSTINRQTGYRNAVKQYSYQFHPERLPAGTSLVKQTQPDKLTGNMSDIAQSAEFQQRCIEPSIETQNNHD